MRKKKIYLIIFMIIIFIAMLFINMIESNASEQVSFDPSSNEDDFPTTYYYYTKIERWYNNNDLVYRFSNCNISWLEREVYLTESLDGGSKYSLGSGSLDEQVSLNNTSGYFSDGSDIYLVESFTLNASSFEYSSFTVGEERTDIQLPAPGTISLNISDSNIVNTAMENYTPLTTSPTLNIQSQYQSNIPDEENRDIYIYPYLEIDGDKTASVDQGAIRLPVFSIYVDLTATGTRYACGIF